MSGTKEIKFEKNAFDLIRYWAVFSIILLHYTGYARNISEKGLPVLYVIRNVVSFFPGVVIFFSMSGFLVSASLERSKSTRDFLIKRVFRMYPELWVCTIFNLFVIVILARERLDKSIVIWLGTQIFGIANTPSCLKDWATGSINGALWTIFVQIQLYLVLVVFYKWLKKKNIVQWSVILVVAAFVNVASWYVVQNTSGAVEKLIERVFVPYAIWFLIGVFVYQQKEKVLPFLKRAFIPLLILYVVLQLLPISIPGYYASISIGILCPLIVIGCGYCLPSIRIRTDITYGMFLYHWIVLNVMIHFNIMNTFPWAVNLILFCAASAFAGWISWKFVGNETRRYLMKTREISVNEKEKKKTVCMIVQNPMVKGGIAAVVNGYRGSQLEKDYKIIYVESYKDGGKITKLLKAVIAYFQFLWVLIVKHPNLIHMHSSFGASFYRSLPFIYLSSIFHIPLINHIHGSEFRKFYVEAGIKKQKIVKKAWDKCSSFIVLSSEWKECFSVVIPREKMTVIENYSVPHENADLSNHQILFLGTINKMKGCYDAIEVLAKVKKEVPSVKLVMGGFGEIDEVKEKAQRCGVEEDIFFPGWVRDEEKDMYLSSSSVFFLPSYSEGMPMSVLDAMGYGLPIVASNVGGIPKLINGNGFMCDPGDIDSFVEALVNLLKDKEKRKSAGMASADIVKCKYCLEAHLKRLEEVYESVGR